MAESNPYPFMVAVIEWPGGELPTVLHGTGPEDLDRAVVTYLRQTLGPAPRLTDGDEFARYVERNPYPAHDASDSENLRWLRRMREETIGLCVTLMIPAADAPGDLQPITRYQELGEESRAAIMRWLLHAPATVLRVLRQRTRNASSSKHLA